MNEGNMSEIRRRPVPPPSNGDVLPEHRQKQVEAGLATYQAVLAERDKLDVQLGEALKVNAVLKQQLESLSGIVNMMESTYKSTKLEADLRIQQYQKERDDAVRISERANTVIDHALTLLHNAVMERVEPNVSP